MNSATMRTRNWEQILGDSVILLLLLVTAISTSAQGTIELVGPTVRNGSFEDGVPSPWRMSALSVSHDGAFASEGEWFGVISDVAVGSISRPSTEQNFTVSRDDGLVFRLSFDARNGDVGFETINTALWGLNGDASVQVASKVFQVAPVLIDGAWQRHEMEFHMPESWDGVGEVGFGIQFRKSGAAVGTRYTGYLDNVVLEQIPEPSAAALLGLVGVAALVFRMFGRGLGLQGGRNR